MLLGSYPAFEPSLRKPSVNCRRVHLKVEGIANISGRQKRVDCHGRHNRLILVGCCHTWTSIVWRVRNAAFVLVCLYYAIDGFQWALHQICDGSLAILLKAQVYNPATLVFGYARQLNSSFIMNKFRVSARAPRLVQFKHALILKQ